MNFARAKTILIFIFVFVNIFLLVIYNFFVLRKDNIDKETLLAVLANNNILVDESLIRDEKVIMQGVEIINLSNDKENLLKRFLGKKYEEKDEFTYEKSNLSLTINEEGITFLNKLPSDRKYKDINEINAGNKVIKTLLKYGFSKNELNVNNVIKDSKEDYYVDISYKYEEFPVFNNNLSAFVNKNGMGSLKGPVITFQKLKKEKYEIETVSEILLEFINNDEIKAINEVVVTDIKAGYFVKVDKKELSTYAIPAYEITLKSGHVYYYDAREEVDSSFKLLLSKIKK